MFRPNLWLNRIKNGGLANCPSLDLTALGGGEPFVIGEVWQRLLTTVRDTAVSFPLVLTLGWRSSKFPFHLLREKEKLRSREIPLWSGEGPLKPDSWVQVLDPLLTSGAIVGKLPNLLLS